MMRYSVARTGRPAGDLTGSWDHPSWSGAGEISVASFRVEGSDHKPVTSARMMRNDEGLFVIFRVRDRYVLCRKREYMGDVHKDSCVEFFVMPRADGGYLNFEFNCGGALKCFYITDWRREGSAFRKYETLPWSEGSKVKVFHSMPESVELEITEPVNWILEAYIPFSVIESCTGSADRSDGSEWRGNFFKCGDGTSHPHWASWSPVNELNFHLPDCFGMLVFA